MAAVLNLSQIQGMRTDLKGRVGKKALIRGLIAAGLEGKQAADYTADFFARYDEFGKGRIHLDSFVKEYKRMCAFHVARNLRAAASQGSAITLQAIAKDLENNLDAKSAAAFAQEVFTLLDVDSNGTLTPEELSSFHDRSLEETARTLEDNLENIAQEAFAKYDRDASGFIELTELKYLASALGSTLKGSEVKEAMAQLDTNGDGKVSYMEFKNWLRDGNRKKQHSKSAAKIAKLKTRLMLTRGVSWISFLGKKQGKPNPNDIKITTNIGTFEDVKASFEITMESKSNLDAKFTKKLKKGPFCVTVDIQLTGTASYVKCVLFLKPLKKFIKKSFPTFGLRYGQHEELKNVLQLTLYQKEGDSQFDLSPEDKDRLNQFKSVTHRYELGWSVADVVANWDTMTFKDLFQLNCHVTSDPLPQDMIDEMLGPIVDEYEYLQQTEEAQRMGLPARHPLKDLLEGKRAVSADITDFVEQWCQFEFKRANLEGTPLDNFNKFSDIKVSELVKLFMYGNSLPTVDMDAFAYGDDGIIDMIQVALGVLQQNCVEIIGLHFRYPVFDHFGFSMRFRGLFKPEDLAGLVEKIYFESVGECKSCGDQYVASHMKGNHCYDCLDYEDDSDSD